MSDSKYLIVDISNILYKAFFVHSHEDESTIAGLATHTAFMMLNKYFKEYKPDKIVLAFDRPNWRKQYTQDSELCISGMVYKGHRRINMTPAERERYQRFMAQVAEFEVLIKEHTKIITLANDGLEADDLISAFIQCNPDSENIIISSDKDLLQLLQFDNVKLIDPATGKERTLYDWDYSVKRFMFEKCFRGDVGDNVSKALPRVRKTRLLKALEDPYEYSNLMKETWKNPATDKEVLVEDIFNENVLLMDLTAQPNCVKRKMYQTVDDAMNEEKHFNYFQFIKFCGKMQLKKVSENADFYSAMFNK